MHKITGHVAIFGMKNIRGGLGGREFFTPAAAEVDGVDQCGGGAGIHGQLRSLLLQQVSGLVVDPLLKHAVIGRVPHGSLKDCGIVVLCKAV